MITRTKSVPQRGKVILQQLLIELLLVGHGEARRVHLLELADVFVTQLNKIQNNLQNHLRNFTGICF